jgi:lysophospholipase L1-like esterase
MADRRFRGRAVIPLVALLALVLTGAYAVASHRDDAPVAASATPGPSTSSTATTPATTRTAAPSASATTPSPTPTPIPSPTGPTTATPLTVVALGDSVPSATNCNCEGYVEQLGTLLHRATRRPVAVHNDASGGGTSADLARDLQTPAIVQDLRHADLVIIEVGANDFSLDRVDDPACLPVEKSACWSTTMDNLRTGLTRIVSNIRAIDRSPQVRVAVAGYWNITVDGAVGAARGDAFVTGSDALTKAVNTTIAGVAATLHAIYVDAYTPFKGDGSLDPTSALLDDGDHPNAKGHALLAKAVLDALTSARAVAAWTPAPAPNP